jgi:hypothetical protein
LNGFTFFSKPLVSSYTYDATCSIWHCLEQ